MSQLTYRFAQPADAQLYFDWANDPATHQQSFNPATISLENHVAWFTRKLADADALLLIFENEAGEAIGQARFERTPVADMPDEISVDISVDAGQRGNGLASQLIEQGCAVCREKWGAVTIHAYIMSGNRAAGRAFEEAGFTLAGESGKFDASGQHRPALLYVNSQ